VDAQAFVDSVEKELETLRSYSRFPKMLAKYRYGRAMYVNEAIEIVNCFSDILGGWFVRNKIRAQKYVELYKTIKSILDLLKNFTLIYE